MSDALIDRLYAKDSEVIYLTREEYGRRLEGWDIEPVEINGELAFAFLIRGPELHYNSFDTGHRIPLKRFVERLWKVVDQHGYLITRTPKDAVQQQKINRRLGFVVTGEDEYDIHFRLERRATCQQ